MKIPILHSNFRLCTLDLYWIFASLENLYIFIMNRKDSSNFINNKNNTNTPHYTTLHYTALHCTALHCTALHCTALHCTAQKHEIFHSMLPLHRGQKHCNGTLGSNSNFLLYLYNLTVPMTLLPKIGLFMTLWIESL